MVGQYLTDEEIKSQSENLLRGHSGFSTMLLEQYDSKGLYLRHLHHRMEILTEFNLVTWLIMVKFTGLNPYITNITKF